jgi:hypothetical protein
MPSPEVPLGRRAGDVFGLYRLAGNVAAVLVVALIGVDLVRNAWHPIDHDFVSFWGAARLALAGSPEAAYNLAALHALQSQFVTFAPNAAMPFPYPPAFMLLVMPFALLPFAAGMAAWSVATAAAWLVVVRRLFPSSGWLAMAFPAVYASGAIGQNGCLTAAVFGGGLLLLPRRPFVAGLVLGCLVLKPQMALLLPVAMLAGREWRAVGGAMVSAAGVLIGGLLLFGADTTSAWLAQLPLYGDIARNGLVGWPKLASVYAAARQAGLPGAPALALHGIVAVGGAWAVWRAWRSDAELLLKISVLAAATMLASPYLFFYDAVILAVPLFFLAERKAPPVQVAALWATPILAIAMVAGGTTPINLNPVVPLGLMAMLWHHRRVTADGSARLG